MHKILTFKTITGDTLLGGFVSFNPDTSIILISYPIKVIQQMTITSMGMIPSLHPMLFHPFGDSQIFSFNNSYFVTAKNASDFDTRWYKEALKILITAETKRIIISSAEFDRNEYADKYIMPSCQTLQ